MGQPPGRQEGTEGQHRTWRGTTVAERGARQWVGERPGAERSVSAGGRPIFGFQGPSLFRASEGCASLTQCPQCVAQHSQINQTTLPGWPSRTGACRLLTLLRAAPRLRPQHEDMALIGTSTRRGPAQRTGGWCEPGRRRRGMDPGASGPNEGSMFDRPSPVGSGAERQRYRAAPIGGRTAVPPVGHSSAAQPNEGGTAEGTTFRPGRRRSFLDSRAVRTPRAARRPAR